MKAGAAWQSGKAPMGCERSDDQMFRLWLRVENGDLETFKARFVIDATGAGSVLARHLGSRRLLLDHLAVVYGCFEAPTDAAPYSRATVLEAVREGWWYLAALPGRRVAVALATEPEMIRSRMFHRRDEWFAHLLRTSLLSNRLDGCRLLVEDLTVRPAPTFRLDQAAGTGWFAVGDAASTYDPISSQGIHKALSDGIRAADAIAQSIASHQDTWQDFDSSVKTAFEIYLANRNFLYGQERRWPDSPFWRARHNRIKL